MNTVRCGEKLRSGAVNEKKSCKMGEKLNVMLQNKERRKGLFLFIPEESGSEGVTVVFCLITVFQKCHESQVMNVIMVSSVQKQV